jgi:predicted Zn-dependent protease
MRPAQVYISALTLSFLALSAPCFSQFRTNYSRQTGGGSSGQVRQTTGTGVYPQFRSGSGVIHWVPDQMPLKVFVSRGLTLDSVLDGNGVPACNVNALDHWPDVVADSVQNAEQFKTLSVAEGYSDIQYQAAIQGINAWKPFEKEGIFSYQFTEDPSDADIYVFWTNHFVNNLGLGLFANDIRGYTAKRSFWYKQILSGKTAPFKPVVIMLRTTDSARNPMVPGQMKASASHEFGHALGIEGHSLNPHDLMSVYYGNGTISPSDAATIRYLYHTTPDLIP